MPWTKSARLNFSLKPYRYEYEIKVHWAQLGQADSWQHLLDEKYNAKVSFGGHCLADKMENCNGELWTLDWENIQFIFWTREGIKCFWTENLCSAECSFLQWGVGDGVMTMIRMSVATVTASLAAEISLCAVRVYNHHLGWHCNRSINLLNWLQRHWCCKMESLTQKVLGWTGIWRNQLCLYSWKEEIQVKVKGKHPKQV